MATPDEKLEFYARRVWTGRSAKQVRSEKQFYGLLFGSL